MKAVYLELQRAVEVATCCNTARQDSGRRLYLSLLCVLSISLQAFVTPHNSSFVIRGKSHFRFQHRTVFVSRKADCGCSSIKPLIVYHGPLEPSAVACLFPALGPFLYFSDRSHPRPPLHRSPNRPPPPRPSS